MKFFYDYVIKKCKQDKITLEFLKKYIFKKKVFI